MLKKLLMSSVIAGVIAFGIPTATALAQQTTAEQDAKKAGKEAKTAGQEAGKATKDAAKATGKGVKKGAKKTGQVTKDAAKETGEGAKKAGSKVKDAVTLDTTSALCKDGTTQTGKTKTTACHDHGGVAGR
jgi:type II secretory pathway pseudopilin PulG